MIKPLPTLALAVSLSLLGACSSTSDQPKSEPLVQTFRISQGMKVRLQKPEGFKLTKEHYGFVQPETFSRIRINEVEIPYEQYRAKLSADNLFKNQLQLINSQQVEINGANCTLLTLRQVIAGTYYEKLWLIAGDNLSSLQIEASYPESSSKQHKNAIKQSLYSIAVQTNDNARLYTGLPFMLTNTVNFKLVQRNINSVVLISNNYPDASVVISHGKLSSEIQNTEKLAHTFLNNSKSLSEVEIINSMPAKVGGIPAIATEALAIKNDKSAWIYQVTSSQKSKFLLIQALSKKENKDGFKKDLQTLLDKFKFRSI